MSIQTPPDDEMAAWLQSVTGDPSMSPAARQPEVPMPDPPGADVEHPLKIRAKAQSTAPKHLWEQAVDEVLEWVETMSDEVADALMFQGKAPFAADIDEATTLAYYREKMSTPEGRDAVMRRVGIDGYVTIVGRLAESSPQALERPEPARGQRRRAPSGY